MSEHVLVVEDDVALAADIGELLRKAGYAVTTCPDAEAARSSAAAQSFDLALIDIGITGRERSLELIPRLRLHSLHGEILLMTGHATLHVALQAIQSGVYAYLPKPFNPEELLALSRRALAQAALKREKQALAQRLAASEALYRGVVETVEACIVGLDVGGNICFYNRFAGECLGHAHYDLEGRSLAALTDPECAPALARAVARASAGETVRDLELHHTAYDHTRTVRWTLTPLYADSLDAAQRAIALTPRKPPPRVLSVGLDITERLELERKSAEAQAMMAMGTLATSLAHEIRNPLNAAKLQLELLTRRAKRAHPALTACIDEPARLVRTEIERLSLLLDDFLDLARPRRPVRTTCSVRELFQAVVDLKAPIADAAGVRLRYSVAEAGLTAFVDRDKLQQVLLNLVRNSIDALSERGHGQVALYAARREAGGVQMTVTDDGPGLSTDLSESALEPFVTTKPAGTGLGLAIVSKIVAQHGGEIVLASPHGGGTVAHFWVAD
jgi:PAS domain S-box-containing protein